MDKPEDHGGGDVNNPFCQYCTDEKGNLMPRDQVRAKMIQFHIQKQGKTQEEAEKLTDQLMGTMPAWKGEGAGAAAPAEPTTPEPTAGAAVPEPTVSEPTKGAAVPGVTPEPSEPTTEPVAETTPEPTAPEPTTPPVQPTEPTAETPAEQPKPEGETPTE